MGKDIKDKIINYWFPLLGYDCANEFVYGPMGDDRAKEAPALKELRLIKKMVGCSICEGTGRVGPLPGATSLQTEKCKICNGRGMATITKENK